MTSKNPELELAQQFVENTGCHIFLTGKAGTGKTTFLKNLKASTAKRMIVTAPTGVAAINAGGVTLHSFFQLPFGPFIQGNDGRYTQKNRFYRFSREKKQIIKSLDLLVIDEVSMVRADMLDAVDTVLKFHRRSSLPFGGVQLLLIGDLYQLPPVAKPNEWRLLQQYYENPYYFSSHAVSQIELIHIELKKVYRQVDETFIHILNQIRANALEKDAVETLNQQVQHPFSPDEKEGYITLTTHNRMADTTNQEKLEILQENPHDLIADVSGEFPELIFPTFSTLTLKKGAQVMFLRNDTTGDKRYYNGKIGRISSISKTIIHVICPGETDPIPVEPVEWQNIKYTINEENQEIEEETIGRFKQFPLKTAWAITIHKSQGLTFEKAVIDVQAAFAQGQVYVALSRCKTLEGLVLSSPVPARGIQVDEAVSRFLDQTRQDPDHLKEQLKKDSVLYQQQILLDCFNFQALNNKLGWFSSLMTRNPGLIKLSKDVDVGNIRQAAQKDIIQVSENFKRQLTQNFQRNQLPTENNYINERVQKAAAWFGPKLETVFGDMKQNLFFETDNKQLGKKLKNAISNLQQEIIEKQAAIHSCQNGFLPSRYLRAVSKALVESIPGTPPKKKEVTFEAFDISHPQLFEQLKAWRTNLSKEKGVAAYQVMHQKVLIQITVRLPQDDVQLMKIPGVGPKTVSNYGKELLDMVLDYRKEKGIKDVILPDKKADTGAAEKLKQRQKASDTRQVSFEYFKKGMSIKEISEERGLVESTIHGHLETYIETGDIKIDHLLPTEKQSRIAEAVSKQTDHSLKALKANLGDDIAYQDIRAMLAHLKYRGSSSSA